jgi:type III restriction enzyme
MLEKVKFIQEIKVDELLALTEVEGEKEYILKAPTGSGKTYMQGYLINKLLTRYPNAKIIYQSLSKGSLAKQGYDSIKRYNFSNVNPYLITTDKTSQESLVIPTNYNVYFLPRDLNKEKGLIKIPLKDFLTYKTKENVKFLIIDECHESHSNIKPYVNEFDRIYGFSATPRKEQLKPERYVELLEEDCEQIQLIKSKKVVHKDDPIFPTTNNPSEMKSYVEKKVEQA